MPRLGPLSIISVQIMLVSTLHPWSDKIKAAELGIMTDIVSLHERQCAGQMHYISANKLAITCE